MSTISHKMFNDSIGNMNKSANYGSSGGSHKRRSKKQIKEEIKKLLLSSERNTYYDQEINIEEKAQEIYYYYQHNLNSPITIEECKKIAIEMSKIREETIASPDRIITDNMSIISEEDPNNFKRNIERPIASGLYDVFENMHKNIGFKDYGTKLQFYYIYPSDRRDEVTCFIEEYKLLESGVIKEDNHRLEYYRQIYQKVMDRLQKLKELKQQVELDTTGKYEKKGIIELPIGELSVGYKPGDTFPLKLTQKELIDAGYFPEELGWHEKREKASISSKDIAEADKESLLTKAEVGGIKGIISRIKGIFKGKGEK